MVLPLMDCLAARQLEGEGAKCHQRQVKGEGTSLSIDLNVSFAFPFLLLDTCALTILFRTHHYLGNYK